MDAAQSPDPERRRRHRRAGGSGADERIGVARGDIGGGGDDRGLGAGAHRGKRILVVRDLLGGLEQLDAIDALEPGELRATPEDP